MKTALATLLLLASTYVFADAAADALTQHRLALLACQQSTLDRTSERSQCVARANSDAMATAVGIQAVTAQTSAAAIRRAELKVMADERRAWKAAQKTP